MASQKLRGKDLIQMGYPEGKVIGIALNEMTRYFKRTPVTEQLKLLRKVLASPLEYKDEKGLEKIVHELTYKEPVKEITLLRDTPVLYETFGANHIEYGAIEQMDLGMRLPVAVKGALMPDAHQGFGLPIGGVLATENAVIPYAVGVDIGCRMCLSIFDMPASYVDYKRHELKQLLSENTRFGTGAAFERPKDHAILGRKEFSEIRVVRNLKDKAYAQLGSSGSGNHFVEFGVVELLSNENEFNLPAGTYLGLLSHSGSRGLGANIASHYCRLASDATTMRGLAKNLAWLGMDTEAGIEYWLAMNLAGDYASACHHQIHDRMATSLGTKPLVRVENHHNFAWKETQADGRELIVHRKGATPAAKGVLGIIPGSMTAPGFIVRGKGEDASLNSASHGAGRKMSRTKAKEAIGRRELEKYLSDHGVELIGGGLDEAPMAYKDIHKVMASQKALVEVVGTFQPKLVRMDKG